MTRQRLVGLGMVLVLVLLASATQLAAQRPGRKSTPNDTLVSTEILADHRLTFRLYAPKATEVTVRGDFGPDAKLTKDDKGVWSVTVGPLTPDFYSYFFVVDGVKTVDPKNAVIKQGIGSVDSMVFVRGKEADFEDIKDVPHGEMRKVWYQSSTLSSQRSMHVYTPPGYDDNSERYPVFFLLHGSGDDDSGWSTIGRAGFILENLIAQKKAKPMIVVMPNGSLPRPANQPGAPRPADSARRTERFTKELLEDVVPQVEKRFRVRAGAENRALAGLSMGGGQTLGVVAGHPDQFAYVGIWSAGIFGNADEFEKRNAAFFESAEKVNKTFKLFSISIGDKDFLLDRSKSLDELLKKHGIKHELHISGGGHTWINWRHYLNDFAPQLFQ
ncbi:MAG TPA: alpha/beta hydrolase-fold protein [Gemmataceae bacterium]|nr:alpha/beta hydrolase-fold protein [Gemmataceae bacterium]